MTKISAVQVTNAKRLKPFDQEDRDYFAEFSSKPINEKLRELHDSHGMLYRQIVDILKPRLCTNDAEAARSIARLSRLALRDIKHYELALMNHLELIEVTGEWK
jgi:hypothetical protein